MLALLSVAPQTAPATQLSPIYRGPSLVIFRFHSCLSGVSESQMDHVRCFYGYSHYGLDPFAHIITHPSRSSTGLQELNPLVSVDFFICFHQLLNEISVMKIKIAINLITGEGQFRYLLHYCLGS